MIDPNIPNSFPVNSNRDPKLEHNQLRPTSTRSSGAELDECCENDLSKAAMQELPKEF
jgi:hypothetical protein